jgi:molybdate transport system substrate-binding protein
MKPTQWVLLLLAGMIVLTSFDRTAARIHPDPNANTEVLVAAAADLKFAMDSLIKIFSMEPGNPTIKTVFGSSGNFFEQISNGAPFDLFFSADLDYPRKLQDRQLTLGSPKAYGTGHIVLWSKKVDPAKAGINTLLDPSLTKIAIANPAHAPYGRRAEESLRYYKLYDKIKDRLVIGENISQTAEFVNSGAADIGIIALSLALSPALRRQDGKYWLIPDGSHQPLQQGYVLLQHAKGNTGAEKFAAFMGSARAIAILHEFGFDH